MHYKAICFPFIIEIERKLLYEIWGFLGYEDMTT
jgi:hypothetical protein